MRKQTAAPHTFPDPPYVQALLSSTRFAWLWLIVRLYVGWSWLSAGWGKIHAEAWVKTGMAVKGFLGNAVEASAYNWYANFIQFILDKDAYVWMAKLIAWGELLVGLGLILGALTGFAAFFGALMNFNFMLAGTASTNPVLFLLSILLIMAWKVAGYYGADRWLLPLLGTPWGPRKKNDSAPR